jgi:hypothetical protein
LQSLTHTKKDIRLVEYGCLEHWMGLLSSLKVIGQLLVPPTSHQRPAGAFAGLGKRAEEESAKGAKATMATLRAVQMKETG